MWRERAREREKITSKIETNDVILQDNAYSFSSQSRFFKRPNTELQRYAGIVVSFAFFGALFGLEWSIIMPRRIVASERDK